MSTHSPALSLPLLESDLGQGVLCLLSLFHKVGLFTQAFAHSHSVNQRTYSEHLPCGWQPGPELGDGLEL